MKFPKIEVSYNIPIGIYNKTLKRENVVYYDNNNAYIHILYEYLINIIYYITFINIIMQ